MRLGLIGWFGHRNAGDERILWCLRRLFAGDSLVVAQSYGDASSRKRLDELNACDFVILGGGGLIVRRLNRYARLFESSSLKPPLACMGLGVEARHRDNEALIQVLLDRAEFILVRDAASQRRLGAHPKVMLGPDLTFLYPYDVVDWAADRPCAVNLRPWPFWKAEFQGRRDRLMRRLARRLSRTGCHPVLQAIYPLSKWNPRRAVDAIRRRFPRTLPLPLYCPPQGESDATVLGPFFEALDPQETFSPTVLARCSYLVGMRLHSLIFACQMGIPFVSLSYQPKNEAFCEDVGMSSVSVSLFDPAQLEQALDTMIGQSRQIRGRLLAIRDQNVGRIWQTVEPLVRHIRGSARPARSA